MYAGTRSLAWTWAYHSGTTCSLFANYTDIYIYVYTVCMYMQVLATCQSDALRTRVSTPCRVPQRTRNARSHSVQHAHRVSELKSEETSLGLFARHAWNSMHVSAQLQTFIQIHPHFQRTHTYSPNTQHSQLHQCPRHIVTFLYFCRGSIHFCQMFATYKNTHLSSNRYLLY